MRSAGWRKGPGNSISPAARARCCVALGLFGVACFFLSFEPGEAGGTHESEVVGEGGLSLFQAGLGLFGAVDGGDVLLDGVLELVLFTTAEGGKVVDAVEEVSLEFLADELAGLVQDRDAIEAGLVIGRLFVIEVEDVTVERGGHRVVFPVAAIAAGVDGVDLVWIAGEENIEAVGLRLEGNDFGIRGLGRIGVLRAGGGQGEGSGEGDEE